MTENVSLYPELHGKTVKFVDEDKTSDEQAQVLRVDFTDGTHMLVVSQGYAYCTSGVHLDLIDKKDHA